MTEMPPPAGTPGYPSPQQFPASPPFPPSGPAPFSGPPAYPGPAPFSGPPAYPGQPQISGPPVYPGQQPAEGPVIVRIGELAVTSSTVHTPAGDIPLRGSTWLVTDHWMAEQKTPTWAIVLAIVGFCVVTLFSLLFLLVKETIYRGSAQIVVSNGPHQYVARLPLTDQAHLQHINQQVNYVRSLAAL